ncbi:MAG: hypothetical protein ACD_29C00411G0002 [uncultured bacterium]|nr:MAG: hypothetical protein ACD_29C00411G0002 [uncultured bacterium]
MNNIVYLNGNFIAQNEACVSIMDRGFLFGDGIYEVVPIFDGKPFGFDEHMARMEKSLAAIQIKNPLTHSEWRKILETLVIQNNKKIGNHALYCQITRGAGETRTHSFSSDLKPTVVAFLTPGSTHSVTELSRGFSAISVDDSRRRDCYIKAIALLPNILHMQEAKLKGAIEAILIRNDETTEGTSSNLFIVKNKKILTPPLSCHILSGITRDLIIRLAKENNISIEEVKITSNMLKTADEIWVTGSVKEICPIVVLNEKPVGDGKVGAIWKQMIQLYEACKQ